MRLHPRFGIALASVLMAAPLVTHAQVTRIEPEIVDSSTPVEDALHENSGRASTSILGKGSMLAIDYSSDEVIQVYMVPLDAREHFVPTDFLHFTLPAGENSSVVVNLTGSPGWRPVEQKWVIHLLSRSEETQAGFHDLAFVPATPLSIVGAALRHLMTPEAYTPSSYHALRGYRIMNVQISLALGILTLLAGVIVVIVMKKPRKLSSLVTLFIVAAGLYQLRFSVDLLRFSDEHLRGYASGTYDEAGSVYQIADTLTSFPEKETGEPLIVYVCRDGTNYKEKILRLMSFPVRISSVATDATLADYAVVMNRGEWALEETTEDDKIRSRLRCDAVWRDAQKVTDYPDGSVLFRLLP